MDKIWDKPMSSKTARIKAPAAGRQAVIDIGSNSVRLVIYDGPRRAPMPICNEKALCGLGREMTPNGALNPAAVDYTLSTLRRFRSLLKEHNAPPTRVIATAAVREAKDGAAFIDAINRMGFTAEIIDGEQEARLAGMGVASFEPGASGLVGDMGGGSLEVVALNKGKVGESASLSIGPFRLMRACDGKIANAPMLIDAALDAVPWIRPGEYETLYSVGGAWRALARIHMRLRRHPLSVLHHYALSADEAIEICNLVAKQSRRSLLEIPGIPHRRLDTLPFAALVLKSLLRKSDVKSVVTSAGGVREGLLFDALSADEKALDPLAEGARFFAERLSPDPAIGAAIVEISDYLFTEESREERRIRITTCRLADIAAFFHPDHRAKQAFDMALHAPFSAINHLERVAIAVSLHCRHAGKPPAPGSDQVLSLLSPEQKLRAVRLGLAMRFCGALAPKAPAALAGCGLFAQEDKLLFRAPRRLESLMGELPRKRLAALAQSFDAAPAEEYF